MTAFGLLLAALAGGAAGWLLARRGGLSQTGSGVSPHLLPDPALDWLRRCYQLMGVWIAELDEREGPRAERVVDGERLTVAQIVAVDRRLERARDQEQSGAERMEGGTLVFHAASGVAVGLLLPDGGGSMRLAEAEIDLRRLAEGVRRRPQLIELAQAHTQEASLESVGSVGLRLAYQLERIVDGQVVVAALESTPDPEAGTEARVRVVGVSGRGDRRLLDTMLPSESELARVAAGELDMIQLEGDPLGGVVADRRQHPGTVLVLAIQAGTRSVGAAALWLPQGREPTGSVRAEVLAALSNAGPRVVTGLEADRLKVRATVDPLTSLLNRRGLDGSSAAWTSVTAPWSTPTSTASRR